MSVIGYVNNTASVAETAVAQYVPRGRNELRTIFDRHFADFCDRYDEQYRATYRMHRVEHIQ